VLFVAGCGDSVTTNNAKPANTPARATANTQPTNVSSSPKPTATQSEVANGDYPGKGEVTKINLELGSVEMNHEEIVGVMPAMRMEFFVSDKKMLDGLNVGDAVDFTLRYKDRTETIVGISKSK
jgi:Cu/Ag efflux protein CusF